MAGFSENRQQPKDINDSATESIEKQRELLTRVIEQAIVDWLDKNIKEREPNEQDLINLTKYLAKEEHETLQLLANNFGDVNIYPDKPSIRFENLNKEKAPVVSLLGWRNGQASSIHNHGPESLAAYNVFQGAIIEERFILSEDLPPNEEAEVKVQKRHLAQGEILSGGTKLIHRVSNVEGVLGVSLHAYYPPIKTYKKYNVTEAGTIRVAEEISR